MSKEFKLLLDGQVEVDKWLQLINKSSFATPFQSPAFHDFFNSVPGLSARVFAVEVDCVILALCVVTYQKERGIKGYYSRRAIVYGGPLVVEGGAGKAALSELLKDINRELKNAVIYSEIRNLHDYNAYKKCFDINDWQYEPYLNFHLNCSSEEIAWNNFNSNRQRQIKKAIKIGVQIEEAQNLDDVKEYIAILQDLYRTRINKPLFPYEYFSRLFESKFAKYLLVKHQGKVIGGIVSPVLAGKTIYEYYVCGLDQEYKDASPSVMATYAAIEYGYKNGLNRFDFMGAGKLAEDYGVRDFKAKFGGQLVEHGRFIKVFNPVLFSVGKIGLKLMKMLKR